MARIPVLTEQQAAELDRLLTEEQGVSLLEKIERAGRALAETATELLAGSVEGKTIIVVAGVGNSGAAGMAAARQLHEAGATIRMVLAAKPIKLQAMAAHQLAILEDMGIEPWGLSLSEEAMAEMEPVRWTSADLIIDAILGRGLEGNPRGDAADLIRLINASRRPILAFDMPSGLSGDEGSIFSPCTDAVATLALTLPRRGLIEGWPVVGELWIADIGVEPALFQCLGLDVDDPYEGRPVRSLGPARQLK
ncbi:MAG: NAD(P)H-hydrate epimerase [Chloroflexota bacterium]|nr:NAD(P)H-hydrate epimerase [Chloroflexota bacterium]